jgi:hypothetical protein
MNIENINKIAQNCVQHHPVIVLGNGALIPHNIRAIRIVAVVFTDNLTIKRKGEEDAWTLFGTAVATGSDIAERMRKLLQYR